MEISMKEIFDANFYKTIIDWIHANIYITDIGTDEIVYMNDFMKQTFHLTEPEGKKCWEILQKEQQERCEFCKVEQILQNQDGVLWNEYNTVTGRIYTNYDIVKELNGKRYHVQYSVDITDSLQISMDAVTDELTTLLNRKAGKKRLQDELDGLGDDEQLIIALYDINGLKWVNDTFGHHEGDRLLHFVATKMQEKIQESDFMFRLSGDEFIIVFRNKEIYQAEDWMKEVLCMLKENRKDAGIEYEVSFCYGIVKVCGRDHLTVSDVLGLADTKMYLQKRDYHIRHGRKSIQRDEKREERKKFEYNKEYIFEAFSETVDGYLFAGNLKTGQFMYSNKMVREFGLPRQVLDNAALFWGDLIHPEDRELFLRSNQEIADGKADRHTIFYRAKNAKGQWVHMLCKGRMVRDENGEPDLFAGVIRNLDNVEMRKRLSASAQSSFYYTEEMAEDEQVELEESLLNFVNRHIPGGITATKDDENLSIICFNQTLIEYMNYTHEEFMQKTGGNFKQFIYEEDRESVLASIKKQLAEKDVYEIYYRILKKQGEIAWVYEVGHYKYNDNGERYILSFLMDATDEIIKGQELRFINENSTSGVFKGIMTDRFELTYANEGFYKIYGYTRKQIEEEFENDLRHIVNTEEGENIRNKICDAVMAGENQINLEYQVMKANGEKSWVRTDCTLLRQEDGRIIMLGIIMDITQRHMLEEQLHHTEQIYRFIGNYTKLDVWEYNAADDSMVIHEVKNGIHGQGKIYRNFPKNLMEEKQIHPNSISTFQDICMRIRRGDEKVVREIQLGTEDGKTEWHRITSIALKEENGKVKGSIGLVEDVTIQKEAEIRAFQQEKMREILAQDTLYSVHINLETDRLEAVWNENEEVNITTPEKGAYESVYDRILHLIANEDDRKRFREEFSMEKMHIYEKEENFLKEFEFRQVYKNGQIIWVNLTFRIISSPTTGNKILFLYARNIDMVKRRELSLQKKAELDEITGLYNQTTIKLLIEDIMNDEDKNIGESVFALINIDNFRDVNQVGGFAAGDELLKQIGLAIMKKTSSYSVMGRINGDLFGVYLYNRRLKREIRQEIQEFLKILRGKYICANREFEITVSVGAVCTGERKVSYDTLFQRAQNALNMAKRSGGNHLTFYRDVVENKINSESYGYNMGKLARQSLEWIKKGETKKEVYHNLMEYIGKFYDAEEVTLVRKDSSGKYRRIVGWNAYKKGKTLEVRLENVHYFFELLKKAAPEKSVYISDADSVGYELALKAYERDELEYPVWVFGETGEQGTEYIVLVENCDADSSDRMVQKMLFEMIQWIEYLYDIRDHCDEALQSDRNTGVLNYESFIRRIEDLNVDTISTLGMVGVQMVDLKKYNHQYGKIKGDESLAYVADCMAHIFGRKNCFRVGRTSFLALCENMVYDEFTDRHRMLEQELEKEYSQWTVTSSVWDQAAISPQRMQEQIEEKLSVAQNKKKNSNATSEKTVREIQENIQALINDGSFRVYLQPKSCVSNGKICGAEALIRLYDKNKGIIPPGRFLPAIEQAGLIRHIDLFILKSVCRILKEWIEEGWKPFPISLNYSRMTILEPDILYETNRIVESFGIDKGLIEIEITESIGSIDSVSLKNIVERFAESGYRIALDDYGAEYSNVYILYSLRLNTLKLDRRIINDVYHDMKARIIVKSVIDICKQFQIECVAEGVETKEHLEVLKEMSCDIIQGYYLNKPLPEEEFHKYYISR